MTNGLKLISHTFTMGRHLLALGERGLHSASKVDYLIRQWVIPGSSLAANRARQVPKLGYRDQTPDERDDRGGLVVQKITCPQ